MTKKISKILLDSLVCPLCKSNLHYDEEKNLLICYESKLAYKIKDGIPIMIIDEAIKI